MQRIARACLIALSFSLITLVIAETATAKPARVYKRDGSDLTGDLVSQDRDKVVLKISGIDITIKRSDIRRIVMLKTLADWFKEQRSKVKDNNYEKRFEIASELVSKRTKEGYELALAELDALIAAQPEVKKFQLQRAIAAEQLKLIQQKDGGTPPPPDKPDKPDKPAKPTKTGTAKRPVDSKSNPQAILKGTMPTDKQKLTKKDINAIRVYEFDFRPKRLPIVRIPRPVLEDFFKNFADYDGVPKDRASQATFLRQSGVEQMKAIMMLADKGSRTFFPDIEVKSDPPAMMAFRTGVHRNYVINYCGKCHSGPLAGSSKFFLFGDKSNTDQTVYTNFYILNQHEDKEKGLMIDRHRPDESLLLRYGLPSNLAAESAHPEVTGMKPRFVDTNDKTYQAIRAWMGGGLYRPAPNYRIEYKAPLFVPADAGKNKSGSGGGAGEAGEAGEEANK